MIDGFSTAEADSDYALQLAIDAELRSAQARQAAFEKTFPAPGPDDCMRVLINRRANQPGPRERYPNLMAAADRRPWLLPLLRRFGWHERRGTASAAWADMLSEMIRLALGDTREVSAEEFVELSRACAPLLARKGHGVLRLLAQLAQRLEREGPLSDSVLEAIRGLLEICEPPHGDFELRGALTWPLFHAAAAYCPTDDCWGGRVQRDLAAMPAKQRTQWRRLLGAQVNLERTFPAVANKLGAGGMEETLRRWVRFLTAEPRPSLVRNDSVIFRRVVSLCGLLSAEACDELLYEVARARWTEKPEHAWFYTYLQLVGQRPPDRAFACLEALMMNEATALPEVRRQYEALLAVFGAGAMEESPVGMDGFPLDSEPALAKQHRRIDQLLGMAVAAASKGPYVDPVVAARLEQLRRQKGDEMPPQVRAIMRHRGAQAAPPVPRFRVAPEVALARQVMEAEIVREFAGDPASLHAAATRRVEWIRAHQNEYAADTFRLWVQWLGGLSCPGGLVARSLSPVEELPLEGLLAAIKNGPGSRKVLELCEKYVAKSGWHAELIEPFRRWIPTLGTAMSDQVHRARAEWLLWFEHIAPIDLDACWSHRVKRDLRAMGAEEAAKWRAVLDNSTFVIKAEPPKKWQAAAEAALTGLGTAAFRERFSAWFEPFGAAEPLRLTVTGRNILRILIWYAAIAKDDAVDRALLGFARAKWKTKDAAQRAAQAEMAFSWAIAQRMPDTAVGVLETLVAGGHAFAGSATHRAYLELCTRTGRAPVAPQAQPVRPLKSPGASFLDTMTVAEFERFTKRKPPGA